MKKKGSKIKGTIYENEAFYDKTYFRGSKLHEGLGERRGAKHFHFLYQDLIAINPMPSRRMAIVQEKPTINVLSSSSK